MRELRGRLLEIEIEPPLPDPPPHSFLGDFFRVHFVEYAFIVLYVVLTTVSMLTVVQAGLTNIMNMAQRDLAAAQRSTAP